MPIKEMIKCEGCGQYHSLEECETVIIRIVKGKHCNLSAQPLQNSSHQNSSGGSAGTDGVVFHSIKPLDVAPEVVTPVIVPKAKNVIPPGIMSMMMDPGHPNFESHGAKERRVA